MHCYRDAMRFTRRHSELRNLARTRKLAKRLEVALELTEIGKRSPDSLPTSLNYRDVAKSLTLAIDAELNRCRKLERAYAHTFKKLTPIDWLVGIYLPDIFVVTLRKEPSTWEGGLYVRFSECVLLELSITKKDGTAYAPATISKSLRDVRAGRHRRTHAIADLEYSHWSFSRLVDEYKPSFPPIIDPMDEPSKILVEIQNRETLQRFHHRDA